MTATHESSPGGSTGTNSAPATPVEKPTLPGSFLAAAIAVGAVLAVADGETQRYALFVVVVGLAVLAAGWALRRRSWSWTGAVTAAVGAVVVAYGLLFAAGRIELITHRIVVFPSLVGLVAFAAGLLPLRQGRERTLVAVGTGLLFVGVVASGVVESASSVALLIGAVATIAAWDTADQAISLGRQVGRGASTYRATLSHFTGTAFASVVLFVVAQVVFGVDVSGLSLVGLLSLLVAAFALMLALRH